MSIEKLEALNLESIAFLIKQIVLHELCMFYRRLLHMMTPELCSFNSLYFDCYTSTLNICINFCIYHRMINIAYSCKTMILTFQSRKEMKFKLHERRKVE